MVILPAAGSKWHADPQLGFSTHQSDRRQIRYRNDCDRQRHRLYGGAGRGEDRNQTRSDRVYGGDNGFLSLVSVPEFKNIADLKGRTFSVDALTTGYAFVLLDLLKRCGLSQADYKIEKAGGVLARWEALKDKKHDATMLITPFDIFARMASLNVLQYAIEVYGHYQGLTGAARREWAARNPKLVEAYVRGYIAGVDFLREPKNKDYACAILRKYLPQMPECHAELCGDDRTGGIYAESRT